MKVSKAKKLASGSWFIHLRLDGENIPVTRPTERECVQAAQYIKAEYLAGKRDAKKSTELTLGNAVDKFIKDRMNILSPATVRGYNIIRNNRFQAYMNKPLKGIDFQKMCNEEARECAPKTLKNSWGFICSVLRNVEVLPPKITLPQVPPNERPFLEPEEIPQFIKAVSGTPLEIPSLLALSSLRLSEICALTWSNIDLNKRCIHVRGAKVPGADQKFVQKQANKNRSSTRTVPIMIDELWNALSAAENKTGFVYTGHPDTLRRQVNRVCAANGLPEVGVHGLRHSFASLAYHIGMPEKVTMEIGGWSDNQTMRKIYTHVAQSDRSKYANAMADFFKQNRQN